MLSQHGFFSAVLDLSFSELVTAKLAKGLYRLVVGGAGLLGVAIVLYGLSQSVWLGLLSLLTVSLVLLLAIVVVRVWLEAELVLMRIADQMEEIAEQVAGIAMDTARAEGSAATIGEKGQPS